MNLLYHLVALVTAPATPPRRDERGISLSTETAMLIGIAVGVGVIISVAITAYVKSKLPTP